jgi:hypothetical protein
MKIFNSSTKNLWLPIALGVSLVCLIQPAHAEGFGANPQGPTGTKEDGQNIRKSPSFQEADKNADHYVTKAELQGYPFLLKHFDKVDAGEDGRLEAHEYENLLMENDREKGQ